MTKTKYKKLVIDRKKWFRGQGDEFSKLVLSDGNMCCLGFLGVECEIPKKNMKDKGTPENVIKLKRKMWPSKVISLDDDWSYGYNTKWTDNAMFINDDSDITEKQRESKLKTHFKKIGYIVSFVN